MGEKMTPCAECGMPCEPGEYHPYAACLMFKGCYNSTTVRANLTQPAQAFGPSTNEGTNCVNPGAAPIVAPENAQPAQAVDVDVLAQEIRRVDGNHSLGAGALAEALMPFITRALGNAQADGWKVLQIGAVGSAYDPPNTRRAFTYDNQPGNVNAWALGKASSAAAKASAGDYIDGGLNLLKALQAEGFGVFQIEPMPLPTPPQPEE